MSELHNLSATLVAGSEQSSYVIKIDGYSSNNGRVKPGDFLKSHPFSVGGHNWAVMYYPNGSRHSEKPADSISVFLLLDSAMAKDVKAKARFSLLDKYGKPVESQSRTTVDYIFPRNGSSWGFTDFIKKADLEGSGHLIDDSLSIRCDVTVVKQIHKGNKTVAVPPSDLHKHLGDLLKSMDGADVIFHVGGESFSAHRYVLAARSSVFRMELFGATKENAGDPIDINDMESDVFRSLLHFIYTDSLLVPETTHGGGAQSDGVMAGHLLVAANRYDIKRLKLICEERLCDLMESDIVANTLALAEQHSFHRIKEACFEFLASPSNLEAMMASDGYQHLKNSCPSVLRELAASFLPAELKAVKEIIMTA